MSAPKFAVGAVVMPAGRPVVATGRINAHGDQILCNTGLRDDGAGSRDCVVLDGILYGASMADEIHAAMIRKAAPALLAALVALVDTVECPSAECSCHLAPPCGDCVEWGGLRELLADARAAIAQARGES